MKVGILGAGAIAYGAAAFLEREGHEARLWSPTGKRTAELASGAALVARGAIEGEFRPSVATSPREAVAGADALLLAVPGYGHKAMLDAAAPFVGADQTLIISSHHSFGALYISRLLAERGIVIPVVAWGTTVTMGRQPKPTVAEVAGIRAEIDVATVPASLGPRGVRVCQELFGDRFRERDGLLAIALSNVNPQNHMALALANITRMERGEAWEQMDFYTPAVGRLIEALDAERLAIAEACGVRVRDVFEHLHLSYGVSKGSVSEMMQAIHRAGRGGLGPRSLETRYVLEDAPYGLEMTVRLGEMTGRPARLHEAGVRLFSALYGVDFARQNDLLAALAFDGMTLDELKERVTVGYPSPGAGSRP